MSEPAKDEAELLEQVVLTTCECHPGECYVKMGQMLCCAEDDKVEAVFAAIRAAGWAVVPQTELDALRAENDLLREALREIAANAAVPGFEPEQRHAIWQMARAASGPYGQKERRAKALSELAEMDADLLDIDPEQKP
jgi:hypothetical protein